MSNHKRKHLSDAEFRKAEKAQCRRCEIVRNLETHISEVGLENVTTAEVSTILTAHNATLADFWFLDDSPGFYGYGLGWHSLIRTIRNTVPDIAFVLDLE